MPKTRPISPPIPDVHATIARLIPHDLPLIEGFWISALWTCLATPVMIEAFRESTGLTWNPARTPLDRMIDQATGAEAAFLVAFIEWFHIHVWGDGNPLPLGEGEEA